MSLADNELDKLFQNMDAKASFHASESDWEAMQQLLGNQRKKRGVWLFFLFAFLPFGIVLSGMTIYEINTHKKSNQIAGNELVKKTEKTAKNTIFPASETSEVAPEKSTSLATENISEKQHEQNFLLPSKKLPAVSKKQHQTNTSLWVNNRSKGSNFPQKSKFLTAASSSENDEKTAVTTIPKPTKESTIHLPEKESLLSEKTAEITAEEPKTVATSGTKNSATPITDIPQKVNRSHKMYVNIGGGILSNFDPHKMLGGGVFAFEYGFQQRLNRWTFSGGFGIVNSFGKTEHITNKYVVYDVKRNDIRQDYKYNRFTNIALPIKVGYLFGKTAGNHLELGVAPTFMLYNNLVYNEFHNETLFVRDEFFNQNVGINRVYVNLSAEYERRVYRDLWLGIVYKNNFGTDVHRTKKDAVYDHSNHSVLLKLTYYF